MVTFAAGSVKTNLIVRTGHGGSGRDNRTQLLRKQRIQAQRPLSRHVVCTSPSEPIEVQVVVGPLGLAIAWPMR